MPVYFEKISCVNELTRAIVRNKQITLLLPDAEVHGAFTQGMIVTDRWIKKWKLEKKLAEWASDWAQINTPTGAEICDALFKQPPLKWSRITPFQDRTMVLMCKRLLPTLRSRDFAYRLPKSHLAVRVRGHPAY
eukprot:5570810-Prymnesium_polylepis.1